MNVLVLHTRVGMNPGDQARQDELDALVQARVVGEALATLGHQPTIAAAPASLEEVVPLVRRWRAERGSGAEAVFNLVESFAGSDERAVDVLRELERAGVAVTGNASAPTALTNDKLAAKRFMRSQGLPTPAWVEASGPGDRAGGEAFVPGRWILKSATLHASVGIEDSSVIEAHDARALTSKLAAQAAALPGVFAERFIEGREFNLSLLAGEAGQPQVLPPAEIVFDGFPAGKPRIVGYAAKWHEGSFEFDHTPRRFDFPSADHALVERLSLLAARCWHAFGLGGYARVDFRVDDSGTPWILEVNTNPCLSPDAGFAGALARAGLAFDAAVARILGDALRRWEVRG